jgi:hypothetical protein
LSLGAAEAGGQGSTDSFRNAIPLIPAALPRKNPTSHALNIPLQFSLLPADNRYGFVRIDHVLCLTHVPC